MPSKPKKRPSSTLSLGSWKRCEVEWRSVPESDRSEGPQPHVLYLGQP